MIKIRLMVSKNMGAGCATIDVRTGNRTQRMMVTGTKDLSLNMGDSIKCVLGAAAAYINPGSPAGAYILTSTLPLQNNGKYVKELVIDANTTRAIHRGSIEVAEDIGNVQMGGTATIR
jgi:hypothetical protein